MFKQTLFISCCLFTFVTFSANAQFFADGTKESKSVAFEHLNAQSKNINSASDRRMDSKNTNVFSAEEKSKAGDLSPFDDVKSEVEANGGSKIYPAITVNDKNERVYNEEILLTMRNFNVYRTPSGQVRCSVRFSVVSTYKEKISNISYQLKWPKMSTRLSFDKVNPNIEYYMDYLLIGDGCYTMDKIPNVIVNRCRVKDKTQKECAASVHWVTRGI